MSNRACCHKLLLKEFHSRVCWKAFSLASPTKLMRSFTLLPWSSELLELIGTAAPGLLFIVDRTVPPGPWQCPHPNLQYMNMLLYIAGKLMLQVELRLLISWQKRESVLECPGGPVSSHRPSKVEEEDRRVSERFGQRRKQRGDSKHKQFTCHCWLGR